jgi:hypothetical protein
VQPVELHAESSRRLAQDAPHEPRQFDVSKQASLGGRRQAVEARSRPQRGHDRSPSDADLGHDNSIDDGNRSPAAVQCRRCLNERIGIEGRSAGHRRRASRRRRRAARSRASPNDERRKSPCREVLRLDRADDDS